MGKGEKGSAKMWPGETVCAYVTRVLWQTCTSVQIFFPHNTGFLLKPTSSIAQESPEVEPGAEELTGLQMQQSKYYQVLHVGNMSSQVSLTR